MSKRRSSLRVFKPKQRLAITGEHELQVEHLASDGRGVARFGGKTVFVKDALPGERVRVRFISNRKSYDEADLVQVLTASEHRVKPLCEFYQRCGGCNVQHVSDGQQVLAKQQQLQKMFVNLETAQPNVIDWQPAISHEPYYYRHRIKLAVYAKGKQFKLGFRQAASHDIIAINRCVITDNAINAVLPALADALASLQQRTLVVECAVSVDAQQTLSMCLQVKAALPAQDLQLLKVFSRQFDIFLQVFNNAAPFGPVLYECNARPQHYQLGNDLDIHFQPTDFTQVNPEVNKAMIVQMLAWLAPSKTEVLGDFFCGIGNLSLPLAQRAQSVTGYEMVASMVQKAEANAQLNGLENIGFIVQDLFAERVGFSEGLSKAVLDPPRAGAKALCELLANSALSHLLYISCNPATLLRDAEILQAGGYIITKASLLDMFPQTKHMECMMLFERRGS